MAKKKNNYYAVRKGNKTGIFTTWGETQKSIKGFSGAEYKGFVTLEEAEEYMNNLKEDIEDNTSIPTFYIDGSYNEGKELIGWGGLLVHNHKVIDSFWDGETHEQDSLEQNSRNIKGEINAVKQAIELAQWYQLTEFAIGYDYNGLKYWALGEWKTNIPLTQEYKEWFQRETQGLTIHWIKIKSHTGHKYNEMADELAKRGADL